MSIFWSVWIWISLRKINVQEAQFLPGHYLPVLLKRLNHCWNSTLPKKNNLTDWEGKQGEEEEWQKPR